MPFKGAEQALLLLLAQHLIKRDPVHAQQARHFLPGNAGISGQGITVRQQAPGQKFAGAYQHVIHIERRGLVGKRAQLAGHTVQQIESQIGPRAAQMLHAVFGKSVNHAVHGADVHAAPVVCHGIKQRRFTEQAALIDVPENFFRAVQGEMGQPYLALVQEQQFPVRFDAMPLAPGITHAEIQDRTPDSVHVA